MAALRNAFGLDPFIVSETVAEVAACRTRILINTFMLARDYDLVSLFARSLRFATEGRLHDARTLGATC
jgi:uncharacterized protein with von Willebrand factor type A (vWA) domain